MDTLRALHPQSWAQWALLVFAVATVSLLILLVVNSRRVGLSHIPGPFWARYTDLWAVHNAWNGIKFSRKVQSQRELQARYGDVIRTGPRSVTVFDPAAVPVIYGVRSKLDKVRMSSVDCGLLMLKSGLPGSCICSFPAGWRHDESSQYPRREDSLAVPQARLECVLDDLA
jgi:hypothetical protein